MTRNEAMELARQAGFSHWGVFPVEKLRFVPEVRAACAENKCGRYEKSWSCPPACGSLEECEARARNYAWGLLVQTTGQMEDDFDVEVMMEAEQQQKERLEAMGGMIPDETPHLIMGAGSCTLCPKCTYPDAPCRFPCRMHASMEAFGLVVTEVCQAAEIPYYYGPRTITYSCCVLFKD